MVVSSFIAVITWENQNIKSVMLFEMNRLCAQNKFQIEFTWCLIETSVMHQDCDPSGNNQQMVFGIAMVK